MWSESNGMSRSDRRFFNIIDMVGKKVIIPHQLDELGNMLSVQSSVQSTFIIINSFKIATFPDKTGLFWRAK